ncbi:GlcNAc transferase [Rickettsia asiatica]|uniref:GlcNAc transferase n=1 Tax=Rickettsia helvetica TaxID=35789 RepID=UPI002F961E35
MYNNYGTILISLEEYELALKAFNKEIELNPNEFGGYINQGAMLKKLGKYELTLKAYDKAIESNSNYLELFMIKR